MSCSEEDEEDGPLSSQPQHFDIWFLLVMMRNTHAFRLLMGRQAFIRGFPASSMSTDSVLPQPVPQLATASALL